MNKEHKQRNIIQQQGWAINPCMWPWSKRNKENVRLKKLGVVSMYRMSLFIQSTNRQRVFLARKQHNGCHRGRVEERTP